MYQTKGTRQKAQGRGPRAKSRGKRKGTRHGGAGKTRLDYRSTVRVQEVLSINTALRQESSVMANFGSAKHEKGRQIRSDEKILR